MSALAIRVALPSAAPAPSSAGAPVAVQADMGFAALLGKMAHPKPSATTDVADGGAKSKSEAKSTDGAPVAEATTATLSALQSLEAALTGFSAPAPPIASAPPTLAPRGLAANGASSAATIASGNAASLSSALATVAGALDGSGAGAAWDSSGKTPLKALLQADPTLGLSDFQMKTHLAAAGATPARAGAATLGADSAWHPLSAAASAKAAAPNVGATLTSAALPTTGATTTATPLAAIPVEPSPLPSASAGAATLETFAPTLAVRANASLSPSPRAAPQAGVSAHASSARSSHTVARAPVAFAGAASAVAPSAASSGAGARKDGGSGASGAPVATTQVVAAETTATPTAVVPLAQLPAFIADQVSALAADASAATPSAAPAAQAKAAQAVKELNISLDPADLGQMTLKLRLAGGKLSVTIDVANPQTLAAIEGDRSLIASRILSGDQTLEDLVIQRQAPTASTPETVSSHASSNDSGASSSDSDSPSDNSSHSQGAPPRRGGGGAFSDLLV